MENPKMHSESDVLFAMAVHCCSVPVLETQALKNILVGLNREDLLIKQPAGPLGEALQAIVGLVGKFPTVETSQVLDLLQGEQLDIIREMASAVVQDMEDEKGFDLNLPDDSADDVTLEDPEID